MNALAQVAIDGAASSVDELAAEIDMSIEALLEVMPAYAPPLNVMHLMMARVEEALATAVPVERLKATLVEVAGAYRAWSESARLELTRYGTAIIPDRGTVFTFTLSETAMQTLRAAWGLGKRFSVLVTESRPNNDGLVTAAELARDGITVGVSIDACLGELIPQADIMIVGAEAIMADGSAICKVGTYPSALVASAHGVPVYVVVDTMKFNITSVLGLPLLMDPLRRDDVLRNESPDRVSVVGHLFDRTPPELIRGIVTERGILSPAACGSVMAEMPLSEKLSRRLSARANRQPC
jgi:translation initiation factor 2B subunit (eIF-2B alpha/beta/delta family)